MKFGGTLQQLLKPITVMWPTIEIFKIRDGGDGRLKKSLFWHNSSTDCPISAKFCTRKQDGMSTRATWQKLQTFEIQHGGRPPFWTSLNRHISVKNPPILMKFGTLQQILNPMTVTWPEIEIFKIQDGDSRHLENRSFLTITHQPIVLFQRNFAPRSRTSSSSSGGTPSGEHSRLHNWTPFGTILCAKPRRVEPRLVGCRSDSMVRSQVRRGRPLRRRQSVGRRLMAAWRAREW